VLNTCIVAGFTSTKMAFCKNIGSLIKQTILCNTPSMLNAIRCKSRTSLPIGELGKTHNRNVLDHKRRLLAAKYEVRRKLNKAFLKDPNLPSEMRDRHRYKLSKLPRNSSFTRTRNRCIFTGRPRAVYALFRVSRIVFRGLARQGQMNGIKKASW
jgi:small subunit ribosomal protein S14